MAKLEAVYLANVILYIKSIETIIKLIQVNKKCQDATKIIRYYDRRKLYENDEEDQRNYRVVKNIFDIFPNVETISCDYYDVKNNLELFHQVKQIELNAHFYSNNTHLPQDIKNKIIKLTFVCLELENIHLNHFPFLKKVKFNYIRNGNLKEFLGDTKLKLNQLIIQTEDKEELNCLKEYNGIENKIIKIINRISKDRYLQLREFASTYTPNQIHGIDIRETFEVIHLFKISKEYDINNLYNLTLFTICYIEDSCDLRKCEFVETVGTLKLSNTPISVQIEGLKYVKTIQDIKIVDCIPPSVTKISIYNEFNYKELIEKDNDCFNNIKELNFTNYSSSIQDQKILMNFKNCTKIELFNESSKNLSFKLPMQVKQLKINVSNKNQLNEIAKLNGLKKLSTTFDLNRDKKQIQKMFDSMSGLERLSTCCIDGIKLPSTITFLKIENWTINELVQYTHLKEISLVCRGDQKDIKLPTKLTTLCVDGNVDVVNSNEIEVNKIILSGTPSQFREWKTKNIFIEREYQRKTEVCLV